MTYDHDRIVACLYCESGEMVQIHPFLARCAGCGGTISYDFFKTLRQIGNLSETRKDRTCECGYREMSRLPDGMHQCFSCGSEFGFGPVGETRR